MKKIVLLLILLFNFSGYAQLFAPIVTPETYAAINIKASHQSHSLFVTSVKESQQGGYVYAYPNPVVNDLTLDFHTMQSGTYLIEILDVSGKLREEHILEVDTETYKEKIDMNNYDEGLYLFKITNPSKSISKVFKVTKQK